MSQGTLQLYFSLIFLIVLVPFKNASKPRLSTIVFNTLGSISSNALLMYLLSALSLSETFCLTPSKSTSSFSPSIYFSIKSTSFNISFSLSLSKFFSIISVALLTAILPALCVIVPIFITIPVFYLTVNVLLIPVSFCPS